MGYEPYDTTEATDGLLEEFGPLAIGGGVGTVGGWGIELEIGKWGERDWCVRGSGWE